MSTKTDIDARTKLKIRCLDQTAKNLACMPLKLGLPVRSFVNNDLWSQLTRLEKGEMGAAFPDVASDLGFHVRRINTSPKSTNFWEILFKPD